MDVVGKTRPFAQMIGENYKRKLERCGSCSDPGKVADGGKSGPSDGPSGTSTSGWRAGFSAFSIKVHFWGAQQTSADQHSI
ncbi:hypothetical protein ABIE78_001716 [Sinorhizobium fredii]|uniref:hypothetical protein n=1 Tax=Rhizobium fredii TaxID=380 RepID=UPI0026B48D02